MNDEKVEELLFSISGKLSSIEAKLTSTQETLLRHESRITSIEDKIGKCSVHNKDIKASGDFREQLLLILSKSLIVALVTLATITGAGSIVPKLVQM